MTTDRDGPLDASTRRSRSPWIVAVSVLVAVLGAVLWFITRPSAGEREARADVAALSAAVAEYVAETDSLPRVRVEPRTPSNDDGSWGDAFLVESRRVPRAYPNTPWAYFFVVGDADRWCVERSYEHSEFLAADSLAWVSTKGAGPSRGGVVDGRCGDDYVLLLSTVTDPNVPQPGSVVDAASAPMGSCLVDVLHDGLSTGPVEVVSCDAEHLAEIYHTGDIEANGYGQYQTAAAQACAAAVESFVGVHRLLSQFTAEPFTVTDTQWLAGERIFSCVLFLGGGDYPLVGSARESWR